MTTATAIADALEKHFIDPKDPTSGVVLREVTAPGSSRRIDLLAVSLWASRGFGIDAVEIKVDRADYLREIDNPAKADPWWRCSNRFWIAAPSTLIADPTLLPKGWGLLVPANGRRFKTVVKAEERQLEVGMPLFTAILGRQVKAAHDRAQREQREVLERQRARYEEELRRARQDLVAGADPEVRRSLKMIRAVEDAAGIRLSDWTWGENVKAEDLGRALRTVIAQQHAEDTSDEVARRAVDDMRRAAKRINDLAGDLAGQLQAALPSERKDVNQKVVSRAVSG